MDTATAIPVPGPATVVDCPWCSGSVELGRETDAIECQRCLVTVEIAPTATASGIDRPLAPAA